MAKTDLTAARLREILSYNEETGLFTWLSHPVKKSNVSRVAGTPKTDGYIQIRINGVAYTAHRLAWLYVNREIPDGPIDHINCIKKDNRIANLRQATPQQNGMNRGRDRRNTSGFKGVSPARGKWRACVNVDKKRIHIGYYDTAEQAHEAYRSYGSKVYGEFFRCA